MTVEMTQTEAEIVIAVLHHAENTTAYCLHPNDEAIGRALKDLYPWRSALLLAHVRNRIVPVIAEQPA